MKNEQILKLINEGKIDELKEKLSQEIALEDVKNANVRSNYKTVYNYLKKQKQKTMLHHCDYQDEMQTFTNTYFATRLVKEDYNPLIPVFEGVNETFPNLRQMFDSFKHSCKCKDIKLTYHELVSAINETKAYQLKNNEKCAIFKPVNKYFNYELLDIALKSLNPHEQDIFTIRFDDDNSLKMITILKENESQTLICPCRPPLKATN